MAGLIERIFSSKPAATPAPARVEPMANQNPGANPANVANQPSGTAANGGVEPIPLDTFKSIWDTPATDPNGDPFSKPLLTMDPTKFGETVKTMNFTDGITKEAVTAAMSDPDKLLQLINSASQKAFAAATQLSTHAIEGSHKTNNERIQGNLGKQIKAHTVQEIRSDNPILNHAATAPVLDMAKRAILAHEPNLTPQQVQQKAEQYVTDFGSALVGQQQASQAPKHDPYDMSSIG